MRQIKFRAWDGAKNCWLHEAKTPDMAIHIHGETVMFGEVYRRPDDSGMSLEDIGKVVWMQFTGLLDKNGKEIYEGDIVRHTNPEACKEPSEIPPLDFWHHEDYSGLFDSEWMNGNKVENVEVIGNIYENPNLLV